MHKVIIFCKIPSGSCVLSRIAQSKTYKRAFKKKGTVAQSASVLKTNNNNNNNNSNNNKNNNMKNYKSKKIHYLRTWTEISLAIFLSRFWTIFSPTPGLLKMLKVIWNLRTNFKYLFELLSVCRITFHFHDLLLTSLISFGSFINKAKVVSKAFAFVCF